jgi:hypothetical protein
MSPADYTNLHLRSCNGSQHVIRQTKKAFVPSLHIFFHPHVSHGTGGNRCALKSQLIGNSLLSEGRVQQSGIVNGKAGIFF